MNNGCVTVTEVPAADTARKYHAELRPGETGTARA